MPCAPSPLCAGNHSGAESAFTLFVAQCPTEPDSTLAISNQSASY